MKQYGYAESIKKEYLDQRLGSLEQLAGIRPITFDSGRAKGLRALEVRNGSGLNFTVLADRALDIAHAEYRGIPFGWICKNGIVSPEYFENGGIDFLRTFSGGLTTTCGLTQVGTPGQDGDEILGIHGRISHLPAENYRHRTWWEGDRLNIEIAGSVCETCLYAENLSLFRTISCVMGEPVIKIRDVISNDGYTESPFMLIYHVNCGYPVVSEDSYLLTDAESVEPWNDDALQGDGKYTEFHEPKPGYQYQCFLHHMNQSKERVNVALINGKLDFGVKLTYSPKQMPCFTEWKMMGMQDYVVGLEPGNCIPEGRIAARENGRLEILKPGEKHEVEYEIRVLSGEKEISDVRNSQ